MMASNSISALKDKLQGLISGAGKKLLLNAANTEISDLQSTLKELLGATGLQLSGAEISGDGEANFTVSGTAALLGASNLAIAATFTGTDNSFAMSLTISNRRALKLDWSTVAGKILSGVSLPSEFDSIPIDSISATLNTSRKSFSMSATTKGWQLALGGGSNAVAGGKLMLDTSVAEGSLTYSGSLTADATIAGSQFTIEFLIKEGNETLTGSWSGGTAGLAALAKSVGVTLPSLPGGAPALGLTNANLTADFSAGTVTFEGQSSSFGEAVLLVSHSEGWRASFGVALPANWKPSDLSSELRAMDDFTFKTAALVVSTYADDSYSFPDFKPLTGQTFQIVPGLTVTAMAELTSGAVARNVKTLLQKDTLFVTGTFGTHLADLTLAVVLDGPPLVIPSGGSTKTNVSITEPKLELVASPFSVELVGDVNIPLNHSQTVTVQGRLAISTTRASLTVDATMPSLNNPLSFHGVSLLEIGATMGIDFVPLGIDVGLEATFQLGKTPADKFAADLQFDPEVPAVNPLYFYGSFSKLSLPLIFDAVIGGNVKLPAALGEVSVSDFKCYWSEGPQQLPDGSSLDAGFGISGTLDIAGFDMEGDLQIDAEQGISGDLETSPINIYSLGHGKHALSVAGHSKLGGPAVSFNTSPSGDEPFASATVDVEFFGVSGVSVDGSFGSESFALSISGNSPNVKSFPDFVSGSLKISSTSSSFSASASLDARLSVSTPKVAVPGTSYHLGSVHITAKFSGHARFSVSDTDFSLSIAASFNGHSLPSLSIPSLSSLSNLLDEVESEIGKVAHEAFSYLFSDAKTWLRSIKRGIIKDAGDIGTIAKVLVHVFGKSAVEVAHLLHDELGSGLDDLVKALEAIGTSASKIVDILVNDLKFSLTAVEKAVGSIFHNTHVDESATHVDTRTPHADTSKHHVDFGHIDKHTFLGHVDENASHVDTHTPHVDAGGHVDAGHVDKHIDT